MKLMMSEIVDTNVVVKIVNRCANYKLTIDIGLAMFATIQGISITFPTEIVILMYVSHAMKK